MPSSIRAAQFRRSGRPAARSRKAFSASTAALFRPVRARARRVVTAVLELADVDLRHLRVRFRHPAEERDRAEPQDPADGERYEVHAGHGEAPGDDQGHQRGLAFAAEKEGRAVKHAVKREAAQAHTTAPVMPSALAMLVTPTMNETTSTSMMMRRTNSWISPPNTSAAPQATMARREMVNATGPVMSFFSVVSGVSQGRLPPPDEEASAASGWKAVSKINANSRRDSQSARGR